MDNIESGGRFGPGEEEEDENDSLTIKSDEDDYQSAVYDDEDNDDESITSFSRGGNIYGKFVEQEGFFSQSSLDLKKFVYNKPEYKNALEDAVRKNDFPRFKRIFKNAIDEYNTEDRLDDDSWKDIDWPDDGRKNFWYQTVLHLNEALEPYNIVIDKNNREIYESLIYRVKRTLTYKKQEINGYEIDGQKIIGRNKQRKFYFYPGGGKRKVYSKIYRFVTRSFKI